MAGRREARRRNRRPTKRRMEPAKKEVGREMRRKGEEAEEEEQVLCWMAEELDRRLQEGQSEGRKPIESLRKRRRRRGSELRPSSQERETEEEEEKKKKDEEKEIERRIGNEMAWKSFDCWKLMFVIVVTVALLFWSQTRVCECSAVVRPTIFSDLSPGQQASQPQTQSQIQSQLQAQQDAAPPTSGLEKAAGSGTQVAASQPQIQSQIQSQAGGHQPTHFAPSMAHWQLQQHASSQQQAGKCYLRHLRLASATWPDAQQIDLYLALRTSRPSVIRCAQCLQRASNLAPHLGAIVLPRRLFNGERRGGRTLALLSSLLFSSSADELR